jgi:hypothetical protein
MDFNKFFTYDRCDIDLSGNRSDKVGVVTLVATKKNIFYNEGDKVDIELFENYKHGRMIGVPPVCEFITYFDVGSDFLEFLFDIWEKNKPLICRYEQTDIQEV